MQKDYTMQDILNLFAQSKLEWEERQKQWDKQQKQWEERQEKERFDREEQKKQWDKRQKKLHEEVQEMIAIYKKAGLIQGRVAEETVYRSVSELMSKRGKSFTKIEKNVIIFNENKIKKAEFDIIAVNGKEVMPIEVKNNLTTDDVDNFANNKLHNFRRLFPEYISYSLIGGIGGLVMSESVENYAQKKGLYVFVQNGENMKIANSPDFVPRMFA